MPSPDAPLELQLPAVTRSVSTARHAVAQFSAGFAVDHDAIAIALSEAVANAVVHAYPDRPGGNVRVHASQGPHELLIIVCDDGQGVAARSDCGGLGVGLTLIARLCSSLQIDGDGGGTRVTMRFARGVGKSGEARREYAAGLGRPGIGTGVGRRETASKTTALGPARTRSGKRLAQPTKRPHRHLLEQRHVTLPRSASRARI